MVRRASTPTSSRPADGQREHRRRLDAPSGLAGPQAQAAPGIDPPRPIRAEVPRPAAPRLHRRGTEREMVRRYHRDPHRRRQALPRLVLDLHSRRLLASATSEHPDAGLACDAIKMAATVRGGRAAIDGVIFHTDRGSTYTATSFTTLCRKLGVSQSMGRVGSCFDNAAAEAFFSTPRARGPVPAPLHHQSSGAPGRGGLVLGLVQQPTPTHVFHWASPRIVKAFVMLRPVGLQRVSRIGWATSMRRSCTGMLARSPRPTRWTSRHSPPRRGERDHAAVMGLRSATASSEARWTPATS